MEEAARQGAGSDGNPEDAVKESAPLVDPAWDYQTSAGRERIAAYQTMFLEALKKGKKKVVNMGKIQDVVQKRDETPGNFLERLMDAYRQYSPFDPEDSKNQSIIVMSFVGQSCPDIRRKLQKAEGFEGMTISQLKAMADKVYVNREPDGEKKDKKESGRKLRESVSLLAAALEETNFGNPSRHYQGYLDPEEEADHPLEGRLEEDRMKQNAQVINQPQYPIPYMARQGIQIHLQRLYDLGILRRIRSAWNTPLLPVKKPGSNDYRPVQDLRKVNNQVADLVALVPNPYSILAQVSPASKWYSVIDLKDAFFSVPVAEECQKIFAFTWENAHTGIKQQYTWTRLPQGFKHSPMLFGEQLAKDLKMYQVMYGPVIQYVDDLLLFRETYLECAVATLHLLKTLYSKGYRASKKKAQICKLKVEYLGFQIREGTRRLGISRTSSIRDQPVPTCKKELRAFLGATGYCRLWIANYAIIAQPLYDKLRGKEAESQPFQWEGHELARLNQLKEALIEPPALGLPDVLKPFHLFVDEKKGMAIGVLTQTLGSWERPVAYLSKGMDNVAKGWPGCLRSIAAACILIPEAVKLTFGQTLQVTTPHTIQGLLETHGPKWMTNSRLVKYQALLCETPEIQIQDSKNLNPATLLPAPKPVTHNCEEVMATVHSSRPDLRDQPWQGAWTLFTDGSSQVIDGIRVAGYAVVSEDDIIEAEPLPPGTSVQKAELIALTRALQLAEGKTVNIYTDSKYAFLTIQVHGALYKERGFLTAEGKQLTNASEIHNLLNAVWAPKKVAVMHCKAHTGKSDPIAKGNQWIDDKSKVIEDITDRMVRLAHVPELTFND
ncbi:uncharacterized protein LOC115096759 [Rhinatrema bivittatum]|uniref:uncharacterized protein LOC115096759 n=1 Tax=Rhinatrema bivittatum TaxID=194408 RepID=UPI001125C2BE|nr:uncharacterized protein LOC115096759 [Rhinatrema bivittatum]